MLVMFTKGRKMVNDSEFSLENEVFKPFFTGQMVGRYVTCHCGRCRKDFVAAIAGSYMSCDVCGYPWRLGFVAAVAVAGFRCGRCRAGSYDFMSHVSWDHVSCHVINVYDF